MPLNESGNVNPKQPMPLINAAECKGCERCVEACPAKCLRISDKLNCRGVKAVEYIGKGCTGCGICFYNCPEPYAIVIDKP
ncbi:MAG: 4Fe-4S dicluster domain-containing protein [Kiritimatiellae bacterium]|jgi:NAD-dependent dihydropyrimidine dehydrogenase PreA subunit|nr:4Fe-4S dicluster domain-containing protein [Kiritimatiellia bacterium]